MAKTNSKDLSFWKKISKFFKRILSLFKKNNRKISAKYPTLFQTIQLILLYFVAVLSLSYSLLSILGQIPDLVQNFVPLVIQNLANSTIVKILLAPEKTYIVYLLVIEFVIFRPIFRFSQLFKYNILLIFLLEMFQNLLISYWDLFFTRSFGGPDASNTDLTTAVFVISLIFLFLFFTYLYGFFCALRGKFVTYPFMYWLTDSIAFWLHIRTPSMGEKSK